MSYLMCTLVGTTGAREVGRSTFGVPVLIKIEA
jgi:hypothetical protein